MITQTLLTFGALAIAAGMISPIQQAGLTQMRLAWGGHPGWMLVASFGIGLIASLLWVALSRQAIPDWNTLSNAPLWSWSAGLIAVAFVAAVSLAAPKLGPVMLVMLLIVGQMTASLVLEHFGLAGYAQSPIDWNKMAGLGAVLLGVLRMRG
jgi:bacterial/archaeal transporter family-2 protein